jgi:oligosaccharide repeat unit polymerase
MWRTAFRPELLFLLAVVQALLPYALWWAGFGVANAQQDIRLNYMPVVIWVTGYVSFLLGVWTTYGEGPEKARYELRSNEKRLQGITAVVIVLVVVQLAGLTKVYGTLPIVSYIRQDRQIDIRKAVKLQDESAVGQVGMLHLTLFVLNALLLIQFIINLETGKKKWALIVIALVVMLVGNFSNGKRQGLFRATVFFCCGLSIYSNGLIEAIGKAFPIPRNRVLAGSAILLAVTAFVGLTGYIAFVRNQGKFERDTLTEIIAYQEFPLINMEQQCEQAGFGPFRFDVLYSFQRLIPYKWIDATGIARMEHPIHPIPSSPAGLYEDIQWSTGLWGVIGFSFAIGAALQWLYRQALNRLICLLIYAQCAFALLVAHSFNEFLILTYDPAPFICFGLLVSLLNTKPAVTAFPVVPPVYIGRLSWR